MYLFYLDDSADGHFYTFSAIGIPVANWRKVFGQIAAFRQAIKESDGIYIRKELHAWKFLSGRGHPSDRPISKGRRLELFKIALQMLAEQHEQGVILFNVALNRQDWAFERILNRINRTMLKFGTLAMLICDEGKEWEYTKLVRKMGVYNPIPSRYGAWLDTGQATRNIPIGNIIEDPLFKQSHRSNLIQMADFCAYALLRKEKPTARSIEHNMPDVFSILEPICFKDANPKDQFGIIK